MIIDSRKKTSGKNGRQLTMVSAVGDFLDAIDVNKWADVEALVGPTGEAVPVNRLSMYVSKLKGDRVFTIRTNGSGVRIWRLQ